MTSYSKKMCQPLLSGKRGDVELVDKDKQIRLSFLELKKNVMEKKLVTLN